MTVLVTYSSGTGYTATYAAWIAGELGTRAIDLADVTSAQINSATTVVFGGGLRAGTILGMKELMKRWPVLRGKKVVLFHCGLNPGAPEAVEKVWRENLTPEQRSLADLFYLRGGFNFADLKGKDRLVMTAMRFKLRRKKNSSPQEAGVLASIETPSTALDRSAIAPIVARVRALEGA